MGDNKPDTYLKELDEYGRKQYIPGAYTGSDMPPYVKYHKNKTLKILALISLIIIAIGIIINIYQNLQ